jgi:predicted negative regulator of RcsB-dependent stress response
VLGPDDPATLSSEGHLASLRSKHPELAAKLSGDSIGAAPEKPSLRAAAGQPVVSAGSGLAGLGISLIEQGRLRAGRVALEKASASGDPLYAPLASFNLGSLLEQEGDDIRALAAYRKAADSGNPLFAPTSTLAMGGLLLKIGDTAAALAAYERAIKSGQARVACAAAACIGDALLRQGDTLGACEAYERAMRWADAEYATELEVNIRALRAELGETQRAQAPEA